MRQTISTPKGNVSHARPMKMSVRALTAQQPLTQSNAPTATAAASAGAGRAVEDGGKDGNSEAHRDQQWSHQVWTSVFPVLIGDDLERWLRLTRRVLLVPIAGRAGSGLKLRPACIIRLESRMKTARYLRVRGACRTESIYTNSTYLLSGFRNCQEPSPEEKGNTPVAKNSEKVGRRNSGDPSAHLLRHYQLDPLCGTSTDSVRMRVIG